MVVPSLEEWMACSYAKELIASVEDPEALAFLERMEKDRIRAMLMKFAENCSSSISVS